MNNNDRAILEKHGKNNITSVILLGMETIPKELETYVSNTVETSICKSLKECYSCLIAGNSDETYTLVAVDKNQNFNKIKEFNDDIDKSYAILYCSEDETIDLRFFEEDMRIKEFTFKNVNDGTTVVANEELLKDTAFLSDVGIIVKEDCADIAVNGDYQRYYDTGDKFFIIDIDDVLEYIFHTG